jgi:hypothetical protein
MESVNAKKAELLDDCARLLDVRHDFAAAVLPVRCLMFIDKFTQDLQERQDALE